MWVTFAYRTRGRTLRAVSNTMDRERQRDTTQGPDKGTRFLRLTRNELSAFIVHLWPSAPINPCHTLPRAYVLRDILPAY